MGTKLYSVIAEVGVICTICSNPPDLDKLLVNLHEDYFYWPPTQLAYTLIMERFSVTKKAPTYDELLDLIHASDFREVLVARGNTPLEGTQLQQKLAVLGDYRKIRRDYSLGRPKMEQHTNDSKEYIRKITLRFNENTLNGIQEMIQEGIISKFSSVEELIGVLETRIKEGQE
jgi:hypothetical protein